MKPIAWTIAGSDSGGGAGIQADLHTFHNFNVHGCSVITAVTAQNSLTVDDVEWISTKNITAQINTLYSDMLPQAIKLGMLANSNSIAAVSAFIKSFSGFVICDPVMIASTGARLSDPTMLDDMCKNIFPYCQLVTPNLPEAQTILGWNKPIESSVEIKKAAYEFLTLGCRAVVIKGGHQSNSILSQDFFTDGHNDIWLNIERRFGGPYHGSGCTFSAAITAAMSLGYPLMDALVVAKAYVSQGLRKAITTGKGLKAVAHFSWPKEQIDLPWISSSAEKGCHRPNFLKCGPEPLGFYPIVDGVQWLRRLLSLGVRTIQLRIKDKTDEVLENEIKEAVELAEQYNARLFINDYWQLALKYNAYGVHLGQEDLINADCDLIARSGLRLGISTHCYYEVARAHALNPSYIAIGPIYETHSKPMAFLPQGLDVLKFWCEHLASYPIVAIGGIDLNRLPEVVACGVDGVAVISAVTKAEIPEEVTQQFLEFFKF